MPIVEILLILLFITMNGVLALSEIAIVSANPDRLSARAAQGDSGAAAALALSKQPTQFLSTVQIGISLVGILTGAFGGATVANHVAPLLDDLPLIGPYARAVSVGLVVVATTYLSLVIGELVPKRIAISDTARWASLIAPPMQILSRLTRPLVAVLSVSTNTVLRLLGVPLTSDDSVTEEDVRALIQRGAKTGVFLPTETAIVERVFRLDDRRVAALMTPYPDVIWLDINDPMEDNMRTVIEAGFSYYPLCDGDLNDMIGVVAAKQVLARAARGEPPDLRADSIDPLLVPEGIRALTILEQFKAKGLRVAMVVDEYGNIQGIVTLADFLAEIIGATADGSDVPQVGERSDGTMLIDGTMPVDDLFNLIDTLDLPVESERDYQTVAGLVMATLGDIPREGDAVRIPPVTHEVIDMDGMSIDKLLLTQEKSE
ncbi:MAG: hemolysin family protein [Anaerolineae bacterium]